MIRKLPQSVINEISAGEVIQRPFNVIKQLIENSIDAGATQVNVHLQQGGMKFIKIADNGKGIMLQDFPLLCARFATSKIKDFSDMQGLNSFGFRGQALASLSYVSTLTIASKWHQDTIGHSASFRNQQIEGKINDLAMNTGTTITASDLFMKLESRRASLNPVEQKKKIYKLLTHFCLHYPQIRFSLMTQKGDEGLPRSKLDSNANQAKMQIFQQITKLSYDKFSYVAPSKISHCVQFEAIMTKINSCSGKTLMLNINNRIVENNDLFKTIEKAYSECYQSIHEENQTFWVYISLQIDPKMIDCNVHPTKKAVSLFGSNQIYQQIKQITLTQIRKDSAIKILKQPQKTLSLHQSFRQKMSLSLMKDHNVSTNTNVEKTVKESQVESKPKTVYAYEKNRTDCKQLPITFYSQTQNFSQGQNASEGFQNQNQTNMSLFQFKFQQKERDSGLKKFFGECTYVGCYGLSCVLLQYQNKLYMFNIVPFLPSFIGSFCNQNKLSIKQIRQQIMIGKELTKFNNKAKLLPNTKQVEDWIMIPQNQLKMKKLFGISIKNGKIVSYPCLGDVFIQCLNQEKTIGFQIAYLLCRAFNSISKNKLTDELKGKFMAEFISSQFIEEGNNLSPFNEKISNYFKNRVIPVLKTNPIQITASINPSYYMKQMLDLKDIYKIFERC